MWTYPQSHTHKHMETQTGIHPPPKKKQETESNCKQMIIHDTFSLDFMYFPNFLGKGIQCNESALYFIIRKVLLKYQKTENARQM